MARLPEIRTKEELPEDKHDVIDALSESRGRVAVPFSLFLNSPEVARRTAHLGSYIRFETTLSPVARELAILTTAREWDCHFEWSGHVVLARQEGVREEAIDAIAHRRPLDKLTEEEALIITYGRELIRNRRVSNETFEAVKARYNNHQITDLTATVAYYSNNAVMLNAFEAEVPPGRQGLP